MEICSKITSGEWNDARNATWRSRTPYASFTLILPFFPTGTSERVEREGEIATAVTLARILSNIPPSRGGPCSTLIFDIHALQERFYFGDNILPCFESGIPLLLNRPAGSPSFNFTCRLDPSRTLVHTTSSIPLKNPWKRFHAPSSGYAMTMLSASGHSARRLSSSGAGGQGFTKFFLTDSCPQTAEAVEGIEPFEILSLSRPIAEALHV